MAMHRAATCLALVALLVLVGPFSAVASSRDRAPASVATLQKGFTGSISIQQLDCEADADWQHFWGCTVLYEPFEVNLVHTDGWQKWWLTRDAMRSFSWYGFGPVPAGTYRIEMEPDPDHVFRYVAYGDVATMEWTTDFSGVLVTTSTPAFHIDLVICRIDTGW